MRIVISGTHSVGKSTFVKDFISYFPNFIREEEPYRALRDIYDIKFGKSSTCFCNGLQFYYNLSRLLSYQGSEQVIFDRCPVDYIAYSLYTARYRQTDIDLKFVESLIEPSRKALKNIDLLIFIPITEKHLVELEDDGIRPVDVSYRSEVDEYFKQLYRENLYDIVEKYADKLIEIWGTREQRIQQVEAYIK
ncbi:hypothetical protein E3983_12790 [Legionella israelensis]|uniref:NadR/Ttd14 AAA domain-containing protein n=1 Tax=Legionella israelensis TaxID=454 RepID=A0A0W0W397_9GAMM|nr:AAA family ATPase [Legionella israelensis]KTD26951.1 hypothetical protein Lisr_1017 [Legionella israelensis]QBR85150.1 hypothetical protein E3983_12790 [Legionella israelensis]QBS09947.1 hypothetical protein E4T55_08805 [Legionella israelensis]QDP71254.1 AAA family ATPase [Legionella israelensis]SCY29132.1 AAA domain-containing protein [Legionella israelensis DSM 19235]